MTNKKLNKQTKNLFLFELCCILTMFFPPSKDFTDDDITDDIDCLIKTNYDW